ncbi:hypothetical protein Q5Y75_03695 [Ruegeria sp. 2205SS24-7]|uniref:hypothetical protein n=1 Tax=Ruegeria discodermiae TaxID=3064389 RepID=UPI002741EDFC|nr:hypothetical protein [Ruegeria sp. 2205SS24-7]MDP5216311.1 hypothetical protein [Ruegeria sp. 2205SS24-7]
MAKKTGYGLDGCQKEYSDRHPVMNKKGSAKRPRCGCGSWLNHWKIYSGAGLAAQVNCSYMGCSKKAEDGAHVVFVKVERKSATELYKPKQLDGTVFIIPLCGTHNRSRFTAPFFVNASRNLIDDKARDECKTVVYQQNRQNYYRVSVTKAGGKPKCGCSSHIAHYRVYTGNSRKRRCVAMPCSKPAVVAAPVRSKDRRTRFDRYTAPLCKAHAKPRSEFYVIRNAELCPPDACDECGQE